MVHFSRFMTILDKTEQIIASIRRRRTFLYITRTHAQVNLIINL